MSASTSADAPDGAGPPPASSASRLGHESSGAAGERVIVWRLQRNCSLAPSQLLACFAALAAVSLAVAAGFWLAGARLVMTFTSLELLALAVALLAYARHAADGERITLTPQRLALERACGGKVERVEWQRGRVRLDAQAARDGQVQLCGEGRRIAVGCYLRPAHRRLLAEELRQALRAGAADRIEN